MCFSVDTVCAHCIISCCIFFLLTFYVSTIIPVMLIIFYHSRRNSLKFRVFCDEKLIPSQAVEKAFHSFSEEKLNSLFPCKHKEGKTDQSKVI